ncbi:MAG: histidinol-phosphatase [Chitinivibrionales bacterium]|nr:histidinol-phosphatase [Chitinivibrionales bacterium]
MAYEKELEIALSCARQAGKIQLSSLQNRKNITIKSDHSPVTEIDRQCESLIRNAVISCFPDDGFLGEETGCHDSGNGRRWIVDPLDGTRPYIHGIPTYSTLIALEDNKQYVTGVIHFAGLNETYWASFSDGAYCNGERIYVSRTENLKDAFGSSLGFLEKDGTRSARQLMHAMKQWDYCYGYMDAYSYAGVACGRLDVCVNLLDKPWDCAAAACIITEAGGKISDIHGNQTIENGTFIATNGILHDAVLAGFSKSEEETS